MKRLSIFVAVAVLTLSAQADCKLTWCNAKKLSIPEQNICGSVNLRAADSLLNSTYKKLLSFRGKEGQEGMWSGEVKSNQLEWMKERNKLIEENAFSLEMSESYLEMLVLGKYLSRINDLYSSVKEKEERAASVIYEKMNDIYDAIVNNKPSELASLISYPANIRFDGKEIKFKSEKDFIAVYNKHNSEKYRKEVATEKPSKKMFVNYQGRMIANGAVWFTDNGSLKSFNFN